MTDAWSELGFVESTSNNWDELGFVEGDTQSASPGLATKIGRGALSALTGATRAARSLAGTEKIAKARASETARATGREVKEDFYEPETGLEKGIARGSEAALTTLALGGAPATAGLATAGGFLGQAAEEAGAGPGLQLAAELLPLIGAPVAAGKLLPKRADKSMVEAAKRLGMSDKQIAPLVRGRGATALGRSFIAKPATREKIVRRTKSGVDRAIDRANQQVGKIGEVTQDLRTGLIDRFEELASTTEQAIGTTAPEAKGVRFLRHELRKIGRQDLTGNDLRRLYRAANKEFGGSPPEIVREAKNAIVEVISKASPEAGTDFRAANEIYARFKGIEAGPSRAAEYMDRAELWGLITGVGTGHPLGALETFAAAEGGRRAFTNVMMGPRGQRLAAKMLKGLQDGNRAAAQAAAKRLIKETQIESERLSPKES